MRDFVGCDTARRRPRTWPLYQRGSGGVIKKKTRATRADQRADHTQLFVAGLAGGIREAYLPASFRGAGKRYTAGEFGSQLSVLLGVPGAGGAIR